MSDTPNYNESQVAGTSWQRAFRVIIENPYQSLPFIQFLEEKVYMIGDSPIKQPVANLTTSLDVNDPLHVEIYNKLNDLYTLLRDKRDNPAPPTVVEVPPPATPEVVDGSTP